MATYILLSRLSTQGVQTLKSNPDRLREVNKDVEELGAKVLHQWATLGEYDFVNIVEAPDAATVAKISLALGSRDQMQLGTGAPATPLPEVASFATFSRAAGPAAALGNGTLQSLELVDIDTLMSVLES